MEQVYNQVNLATILLKKERVGITATVRSIVSL